VWEVPDDAEEQGHLGFLILEGLLARDLVLAGNTSTELLGEGDVLQPALASRSDGLVHCHVFWHALSPVRLAVLDHRFAQSLTAFPQVTAVLLERAIRRSLRMSVHQALLSLSPVETRLLVLFWYLAERWGRVTPEGIVLPLGLTHQILGQLVGCRRASVTTALKEITDSGMAVRRSDGSWLLTGAPPDELSHLTWHHGNGAAEPAVRR
jgi:CRP/FNR family transcriptional regulator, cyclic AMP receptor protein